jgi:hypothetical protein
MPTVIAIKTSADKVSKCISKEAALKAMKTSIESALKAAKVDLDTSSKEGFALMAKIVSLTADDDESPKKIDAKIELTLTYMGGPTKVIKASNSGSVDGINANKVDSSVADLIDGVIADQLDKGGKLVKEMAKTP